MNNITAASVVRAVVLNQNIIAAVDNCVVANAGSNRDVRAFVGNGIGTYVAINRDIAAAVVNRIIATGTVNRRAVAFVTNRVDVGEINYKRRQGNFFLIGIDDSYLAKVKGVC